MNWTECEPDQYIQLVPRLQIVHIYRHSTCAFMAFTGTTYLHFLQGTELRTYYIEHEEQHINVRIAVTFFRVATPRPLCLLNVPWSFLEAA